MRTGLKTPRMLSKHAALMQMFPAMKVPYTGNTIFLGDAAAMAESLYPGATASGYHGCRQRLTRELARGKWICCLHPLVEQPSCLEMTGDLQKMAEYVKRFLFNAWMGAETMDRLFELAEKKPLNVDEFKGSPYDFAHSIIEHLQSLAGVPLDWNQRLEELKQASLDNFIGVIEKIKEENKKIDYRKLQE